MAAGFDERDQSAEWRETPSAPAADLSLRESAVEAREAAEAIGVAL